MNSITLCMIVKNEEKNLDQCLKNIAGYMDEIIIVDTGSSDKTKEIALQYTDKLYDFPWVNDFAAARNFSISKASSEYILVIDSDEITEKIDIMEMKKLISDHPAEIGRLLRLNEYTRKGVSFKYTERVNRLFSKKYFHYEGMIHEQIVPLTSADQNCKSSNTETNVKPTTGGNTCADIQFGASSDSLTDTKTNITTDTTSQGGTYHIPLTIRHSGYEGDLATRKKKTERNITLLKLALEKKPNDPYTIYQLGKSYYMEEDYTNACYYFGEALYYDLDPRLEYVQDMVESYGYSLLNTEQYETALQLLNVYEEFSYSTDFIFLIALILMNCGKFQQAIEEFLKAAGRADCKMEGVNSFLAFYNIGVIYECLGDVKHAVKYYKKCQGYEPAIIRMNSLSE